MKKLLLSILIITATISCSTQIKSKESFTIESSNYKIHNEFKSYFDNRGVEGAVVIFDKNNHEWIVSE